MRVSNEDRSPVGITRCDTAPTPTGFAEIVSDYLPVLHAVDRALLRPTQRRQNDMRQAQWMRETFTIAAVAFVCITATDRSRPAIAG